MAKAYGLCVPGRPATFIPNKPVTNPKGRKIVVTIDKEYIFLFI